MHKPSAGEPTPDRLNLPYHAKPVVLCTIPSTGTRFFEALIRPHVPGLKVWHCTDDALERVAALNDPIVVTTWRHPAALVESWERRWPGRDPWPYIHRFLFELRQRHDPLVLTFDPELDRDDRLADLSELLGVELTTDWKPITERN